MSLPSESRSLLQQDLFTESHAEKFAKVNGEGKQLAVGGGESTGRFLENSLLSLGGPFQKGLSGADACLLALRISQMIVFWPGKGCLCDFLFKMSSFRQRVGRRVPKLCL